MLDSHPHCGQSRVGPAGGVQNRKQQKAPLQDLTPDMPKQAHTWFSFPYWFTNLVPGVHSRKDFNCSSLWLAQGKKFSVGLSEGPAEETHWPGPGPLPKRANGTGRNHKEGQQRVLQGGKAVRTILLPSQTLWEVAPHVGWVPNYFPKSKSGNQVLPVIDYITRWGEWMPAPANNLGPIFSAEMWAIIFWVPTACQAIYEHRIGAVGVAPDFILNSNHMKNHHHFLLQPRRRTQVK